MLVTYLWEVKAHSSLAYVSYEGFNSKCAVSSALCIFFKEGGSVRVCSFKSPFKCWHEKEEKLT